VGWVTVACAFWVGIGSWLGDAIFLGRVRIAQVTGSGTRYFHVDHLGSVRRVSTGAGALEKAYDFFAYGLPVKETVGQERLWFGGYELEHQNTSDYTDDLYFLHARWYFPYMGRFLSADPVRGDPTQPQSLNLFAYVTDNPLNFVDPWGLASEVPGNAGTVTTPDGRTCTPTAVDRWTCRTLDDSTVVGPAPVDLRQYSSTQALKNHHAWLAMQNRAAFSGSTITAHGFWRRISVGLGLQASVSSDAVGKWLRNPALAKVLPKKWVAALKGVPMGLLFQLDASLTTGRRALQLRPATGLGAYFITGAYFSHQGPRFDGSAAPLGLTGGLGGEVIGVSGSLATEGDSAAVDIFFGPGGGIGGGSVSFTSPALVDWQWRAGNEHARCRGTHPVSRSSRLVVDVVPAGQEQKRKGVFREKARGKPAVGSDFGVAGKARGRAILIHAGCCAREPRMHGLGGRVVRLSYFEHDPGDL
jgi:RHS repeat-associated protein